MPYKTRKVTCDYCSGTGKVSYYDNVFEDKPLEEKEEDCSNCGGSGTVDEKYWEDEPDTGTKLADNF